MSSVLDEVERRHPGTGSHSTGCSIYGFGGGACDCTRTIDTKDYETLLRLARLGESFLNHGMGKGEPPHYNEIGWANELLHPVPAKGVVAWYGPSCDQTKVITEGVTFDEARRRMDAPPPAAPYWDSEIAKRDAEIARLRGALEWVAKEDGTGDFSGIKQFARNELRKKL